MAFRARFSLSLGFVIISLPCALPSPYSSGATDPLRGEYGFLTQFSDITEEEARARVREMSHLFGILEFQFYDAFEGYSHPPTQYQEEWNSAFGRRIIRKIIRAYTDEIAHVGGRSWFYVQAMGTDPNDTHAQQGATVTAQHVVDGHPLLDVVAPNAAWARKIAPAWGQFAAFLGFSGIHWDTLGDAYGVSNAGCDIVGFLRAALPVLQEHGLAQTCNFVDGFGWDPSLIGQVGWVGNVVAFPYWEAWDLPFQEDRYFEEVAPGSKGVFVCYPGETASHNGERWNSGEVGTWPLDLLIRRWRKAHCYGSAYLAIGDGLHHIQNEYFPDTVKINDADVSKIQDMVFSKSSGTRNQCPRHEQASSGFGWLPWLWLLFGSVHAVAAIVWLGGRYFSSRANSTTGRFLRSVSPMSAAGSIRSDLPRANHALDDHCPFSGDLRTGSDRSERPREGHSFSGILTPRSAARSIRSDLPRDNHAFDDHYPFSGDSRTGSVRSERPREGHSSNSLSRFSRDSSGSPSRFSGDF